MRWDESHESEDIVDRRGEGPAQSDEGLGTLLYLLPWLLQSRIGRVILLIGGVLFVGRSLYSVLRPTGRRSTTGAWRSARPRPPRPISPPSSSTTCRTAGRRGSRRRARPRYRHAKLVLYTDSTDTGCGYGSATTGPFYCPADERVYLDLGFFHELSGRLGARGQFAQAYVIAHEIGHHIQKLLGISEKVDGQRHVEGATGASVRLELQADCFAGIWAQSTEQRELPRTRTFRPRSRPPPPSATTASSAPRPAP